METQLALSKPRLLSLWATRSIFYLDSVAAPIVPSGFRFFPRPLLARCEEKEALPPSGDKHLAVLCAPAPLHPVVSWTNVSSAPLSRRLFIVVSLPPLCISPAAPLSFSLGDCNFECPHQQENKLFTSSQMILPQFNNSLNLPSFGHSGGAGVEDDPERVWPAGRDHPPAVGGHQQHPCM